MWPTILVGSIVAAIFLAIIICGIRNRKRGRHACSCGCSGCGMKEVCHPTAKPEEKE